MPYTPQTWNDNDVTKPLSAARMGVIETGIQTAQAAAEGAQTTASNAQTTSNNATKRWSTFLERGGRFKAGFPYYNPIFLFPDGMTTSPADTPTTFPGAAMFSFYPTDYTISGFTTRLRLTTTLFGGDQDVTGGDRIELAIYPVAYWNPTTTGYGFNYSSAIAGTECRHFSPGAHNNSVQSAVFNASALSDGSGTYVIGLTTTNTIPGSAYWFCKTRLELGYV